MFQLVMSVALAAAAAPQVQAIGPKQDDPRQSLTLPVSKLAIGPKQDDPRSPGQLAVGAYNPETDPHAKSSSKCKKKD